MYVCHVIGEKSILRENFVIHVTNTGKRVNYLFPSLLPNNVNNDFNLLTMKTVKDFLKA